MFCKATLLVMFHSFELLCKIILRKMSPQCTQNISYDLVYGLKQLGKSYIFAFPLLLFLLNFSFNKNK